MHKLLPELPKFCKKIARNFTRKFLEIFCNTCVRKRKKIYTKLVNIKNVTKRTEKKRTRRKRKSRKRGKICSLSKKEQKNRRVVV